MDSTESVVPLAQEDLKILRESIWHSFQRVDIPDKDLARLHRLEDRLGFYIEE